MSTINQEMAVKLDKLINLFELYTNQEVPADIRRVAEESRRELTPDYHTKYGDTYMGQG